MEPIVTNFCVSVVKTGQSSFMSLKRLSNPTDRSFIAEVYDYEAYQKAVERRLKNTYFNLQDDDDKIRTAIGKIELDELAPYILLDSTDLAGMEEKAR